jgi:regulator of sigma E protease
MVTLFAFIVAIVVLVVFHEYGHYLVARWCDVKVLRFSVGFGKVVYSRRIGRDGTEWALSAIPLGGYVKMLDEREGEVAPNELRRAFNRKPVLQRMAIVAAGPLSNLLLAVFLYWMLFMVGVPDIKPVLGEVAPGTPAAVAALQSGSTIVRVDGQEVQSWQEVRWTLLELILQQRSATLELRNNAGQVAVHELDMSHLTAADLDGDFMRKLGLLPFRPPVYPVIGQLMEEGAAARAGMKAGDRVIAVNGEPVALWDDWVTVVRAHPEQMLQVEIERDGARMELTLRPDAVMEKDERIGRIGAGAQIDRAAFEAIRTDVRYPPLRALEEGLDKTWETAVISLKMMGKMVLGEVSLKNLSGPITIADYAGQSAQMGLGAYVGFLALISISLGILNLLPIPLLDGGHLLYYSIEFFKGSPVSDDLWEAGQKVGVALLVTMMAFALYNDVSRLILG